MLAPVVTPGGWTYRPSLAARVLAMLRFMGRVGATRAELIDYAYGDDPSGGPDNAVNVMASTLSRLRAEGWPIRNAPGRDGRTVMEGRCPPLPTIARNLRRLRPAGPARRSACRSPGSQTACSGLAGNGAATADSC